MSDDSLSSAGTAAVHAELDPVEDESRPVDGSPQCPVSQELPLGFCQGDGVSLAIPQSCEESLNEQGSALIGYRPKRHHGIGVAGNEKGVGKAPYAFPADLTSHSGLAGR